MMEVMGRGIVERGSGYVAGLGPLLATFMFLYAMIRQYFPFLWDGHLQRYTQKLVSLISPYIHIKFPEHSLDGARLKRSEAYAAIDAYLSSSCSSSAHYLRADISEGSSALSFSMDDHEEVLDSFDNVKFWWSSISIPVKSQSSFFHTDEKRHYQLTFHRRHRTLANSLYLPHVMREGRAAGARRRQRKLYTNNTAPSPYAPLWSHVPFEHPATFETIAMEPSKKKEIMDDLVAFSKSKDYYARIGKAWKRGYLLYGPPGTGKSSLVAAIANFLDYDVYDVELTAVASNTSLRKLLIETSSKSVIVIEDIDCSLDLTGKRKKTSTKKAEVENVYGEGPPPWGEKEGGESKVTLSGLLNFIDGLWSACGGERVIVFTTNYLERLDRALIRRGRMDMHVELSYCGFEAFKVLARNYLGLEGEHHLYAKVKKLMEEVNITPADVAECLMVKGRAGRGEEEVRTDCLEGLLRLMDEMKQKKEQTGKGEEAEGEEEEVVDQGKSGNGDFLQLGNGVIA